jgi:hypothetical protein
VQGPPQPWWKRQLEEKECFRIQALGLQVKTQEEACRAQASPKGNQEEGAKWTKAHKNLKSKEADNVTVKESESSDSEADKKSTVKSQTRQKNSDTDSDSSSDSSSSSDSNSE